MVITLKLTQFLLQTVHFRFAEGQLFFQLVAARAVVAQAGVQFITTCAGTGFSIGIRLYANVDQLLAQFFQHVALGVIGAFQRRQHLAVLSKLGLILT
ncbi:hypothetical protein D3C72_1977320 [compost metagenome]